MSERSAKRLLRVLESERSALLSGDLARLEEITARKEAILAKGISPAAALAETLGRVGAENHRLLKAAARGIESALSRIAETSAPLRTYDATGSAQGTPSSGRLERRR
ncbi:flagellar export chaperone FlgN [Tropicimonas sp. IMCC34011]|uniref:flagellar export chaperone FlgN n=1 Tax=Tropicimonas sp. IMCC34011 TaxID=2248759 RepID=UPI000E28752B|nr:flagellar export chaperone FlgN [Tropicimonas sp. IMCC34011]